MMATVFSKLMITIAQLDNHEYSNDLQFFETLILLRNLPAKDNCYSNIIQCVGMHPIQEISRLRSIQGLILVMPKEISIVR